MAPNPLAVFNFAYIILSMYQQKQVKINKGHTYIDVLRVIIMYTEFYVNEIFYVH